MPERKLGGVKRLARKVQDCRRGNPETPRSADPRPGVNRIAHDRMPSVGKVYTDLMGPARCQLAFEQAGHGSRGRSEGADQAVGRSRELPSFCNHRHLLSVPRIPTDGTLDDAAFFARRAENDGGVGAPRLAGGELPRQIGVGGIVLGHYHEPAGVLVETMDDARPADPADSRQAGAAMGEKGVYQRSAAMPWCGVNDQAGRLVDHQEVGVLVDDPKRDVLGLWLGRLGFGDYDGEALAQFDPEVRLPYRRRARDVARFDQCFGPCARQAGGAGDQPIQSFALGGRHCR